MSKQQVFRFAPSPNGELHLGHAYSALVTDDMARRARGRFLLRIEDVDGGRARDEYVDQIYEDLRWLGLQWETPVWKQSEHMENYAVALAKLKKLDLLYPCFASRREISEHSLTRTMPLTPDGFPIYPGIYRGYSRSRAAARVAAGDPHTLRLDIKKAMAAATEKTGDISFCERQKDGSYRPVITDPTAWGDPVLARRETPTSYTLAVVVDDALQGVTHVTRGEDLYEATGLQRLLQVLLDLPEPRYFHHPLLVDMTGRKLSKSHGETSLRSIRATGISVEELCLQLPPLLF